MSEALVQAVERFLAAPLMMQASAIQGIAAVAARLRAGSPAPVAAAGAKRDGGKAKQQKAVAWIGIFGPMTPRADLFTEIFGGAPMDLIGAAVDMAANDPAYSEIVLEIDSPGGSVMGCAELADKVYQAKRKKRVTAVANGMMASAAYYVGSQASELVVSPSAMVGSIGVYTTHVDTSRALDAAGVKVTLISSTPEKVAANEYAPLDELGLSQQQGVVNGYFKDFVRAVADGRRVSQTDVRDRFGRGGVVLAADAVGRGMADTVATLDDVLARYGISLSGGGNGGGSGHRAEVAERKLRLDNGGTNIPPPPPAPPKPTRPANRSAEQDHRVALHESGHAVCCLALGVPVVSATVQPGKMPDGSPYWGMVNHAPRPGEDDLVIAMAGSEAERGYFGAAGPQGGPDAAAASSAGPSARRQARDRAERILSGNWAAVINVANALVERRVLTGEQVRQAAGYIHAG